MDFALLETFRALTEEGSTQAAARRLGLSQSAVSRRLAQLEAELGLALFVRDRGRLVPTREFSLLKEQMLGLLDHGARLSQRALEIRSGNSATMTLRVAFPASLTLSIVPEIIADFLAQADRTLIEVHTGAYDTIERMLLDERAEIGFVRLPCRQERLVTTPLIETRTVCVLAEDHPLAARKTISVKDLQGVPLILLGRMRLPRGEIDDLFWKAGLRPQVRVEAHSVQSACALAAKGLGVTLVNELMARDFSHLPVVARPLHEPLYHHFAFASVGGVPSTEAADSFIRIAIERFRSLLNADSVETSHKVGMAQSRVGGVEAFRYITRHRDPHAR